MLIDVPFVYIKHILVVISCMLIGIYYSKYPKSFRLMTALHENGYHVIIVLNITSSK